ncbi:MAG: hypothetical protein PSX42_22670 [bacterium]|nr:hypothetical protein [bacterium]
MLHIKEILIHLINKIFEYLSRHKPIYKYVARVMLLALLTELASVFMPEDLKISYANIRIDYGLIPALFFAFFIGKYLGGYSLLSLFIKSFFLFTCLIIDYKTHKKTDGTKKYSIFNFVFGFNNNVTNNIG